MENSHPNANVVTASAEISHCMLFKNILISDFKAHGSQHKGSYLSAVDVEAGLWKHMATCFVSDGVNQCKMSHTETNNQHEQLFIFFHILLSACRMRIASQ